MGWTVLNKTATESCKSKKREATPQENRLIFKDMHPAIVDEETWNVVQRLWETKRVRERIGGEPNPLTEEQFKTFWERTIAINTAAAQGAGTAGIMPTPPPFVSI